MSDQDPAPTAPEPAPAAAVEPPAAQTPAPEPPGGESTAAQAPVAETPVAETPVAETPVAETTALEEPAAPTTHSVSELLEDKALMAAITPTAPAPTGTGPKGKVRSPAVTWVLTVITLGIYGLFWYYNTNRELRDYDSRIVVSPGLAVLSLFIPIVNWFSIYNTGKRIRQAQEIAGVPVTASGGIGVLLSFLFAFFVPYYTSQVNGPWQSGGA